MKSELKIFVVVSVVTLIFVNLYVVFLNNKTSFKMNKEDNSTANYVVVEEKEIGEDKIDELVEVETNVDEKTDIVYDNMTLEELAEKIDRSLNSTIAGKGHLIASYALDMNVDPYMATAIMLHETGCTWECSYLVKNCNNVGGQKGSGCGSYSYFDSLDEGIIAFINNLYRNYISYGLTTPETINSKYAEDPNWSVNVNKYIENIKAR